MRELEASDLVNTDRQPASVSYELIKLGYSLSPLPTMVSEIAQKWRNDLKKRIITRRADEILRGNNPVRRDRLSRHFLKSP